MNPAITKSVIPSYIYKQFSQTNVKMLERDGLYKS